MQNIIKKSLEKAISYQEFRNLMSELVLENKATGKEQSAALANYTNLNNSRMKRLDKTLKIPTESLEQIQKNNQEQTWLLITESWCGDAAQTIPMVNKIASTSENIDLKLVLRDENEELMNLFLTNGNKAIPILIVLEKNTNNVLKTWGPRPKTATKMVDDYKKEHGGLDAKFKEDLQKWYNKDKGLNTLNDIISILN
ncbi:thioredoxin family protein [Bacteroidota bacterium]